jgi:signal transduction histidine kinase
MTFAGLISSEANRHSTMRARRTERHRIALELRDTLLRGLAVVSGRLQAAAGQVPADPAAKPRFHSFVKLVHHVLEGGRAAVEGSRSPGQEHGLGRSLAAVPELLGLAATVKFQVVVEGRPCELSAELHDEIYRIACEAIVNAFRHSGAQNIEAQIVFRPTELRVTVRDNGCGMHAGNLQCGRAGHWGLQGMHERAKRIGARFRIMSRTALGTDVELLIPGRVAFSISPAVC